MGRGYKVLRSNDLQGIASILPFTEPFQNVSNHFKIESSKINFEGLQFKPQAAGEHIHRLKQSLVELGSGLGIGSNVSVDYTIRDSDLSCVERGGYDGKTLLLD